jgi:hypothetical protein
MRNAKSIFGLILAALPVLYCGGFLLYFNGVRTSYGGWLDGSLGPTMIGLGVVGLLFLIPLVLKIRRLLRGTGAPGAPGAGRGGGRSDDAPKDEGSDFDPEAAISRYMAQRSSGARGPASPPARPAGGGLARQAGFGRRGA